MLRTLRIVRGAALVAVLAIALVIAQPLRADQVTGATRTGVLVLNGTHRVALAARVSSALSRRGFAVRHVAKRWVENAPRTFRVTHIYIDPVQPSVRLVAHLLEEHLRGRVILAGMSTPPIARLAKHAGRPQIVLVLGSSFAGLR